MYMGTRDGLQMDASPSEQLPFDEGQQQAIVGHVMTHEAFFRQLHKRMLPSWFTDSDIGKIYHAYCDFYEHYNHVPTSEAEFKDCPVFMALDQADRVRIHRKVDLCRGKTQIYGMDYLAEQVTIWQKAQLCFKNLPQVVNLLNSRQVQKAEDLLHITSKDLLFSSFQQSPTVDWTDWRKVRESERVDIEGAVTTGLSLLDRKILSEGKSGALLPGDTTVVIAASNSGKTSALLTIIRHNIHRKKKILWITREGRENDMFTKMLCCMLKRGRADLWQWSLTPEGDSCVDQMTKIINLNLHYIHMPKVNAYVEDVVGDIVRMQAALKATTGKGYDLVVVDYPALFHVRESQGSKWDVRQIQDFSYRQFVQLAAEQKFHCLLAAQTNREGSKVNKGITGKRLLGQEDIAEAFGIIMSATNAITINRDERAIRNGYLTYYIVKSRSGETGWAITAKSDFKRGITHSDELGAIAYRGNHRLSDQVDELLRSYVNKDVPEGIIDGYKINIPKEGSDETIEELL